MIIFKTSRNNLLIQNIWDETVVKSANITWRKQILFLTLDCSNVTEDWDNRKLMVPIVIIRQLLTVLHISDKNRAFTLLKLKKSPKAATQQFSMTMSTWKTSSFGSLQKWYKTGDLTAVPYRAAGTFSRKNPICFQRTKDLLLFLQQETKNSAVFNQKQL